MHKFNLIIIFIYLLTKDKLNRYDLLIKTLKKEVKKREFQNIKKRFFSLI